MSGTCLGPIILRRYRVAAGLGQSRLARMAALDHTYICRIESGQRRPGADAVRRLAVALHLHVEEAALLMLAFGYIPDTPAVVGDLATAMLTCTDPKRQARARVLVGKAREALTGRMS